MTERAEIGALLDSFDDALENLRVAYEKYFSGVDRVAPVRQFDALRRQFRNLERVSVRSTQLRFRMDNSRARFVSFQHYWTRVEREIERGVSRRDLLRLRAAAPPAAARASASAESRLQDTPTPDRLPWEDILEGPDVAAVADPAPMASSLANEGSGSAAALRPGVGSRPEGSSPKLAATKTMSAEVSGPARTEVGGPPPSENPGLPPRVVPKQAAASAGPSAPASRPSGSASPPLARRGPPPPPPPPLPGVDPGELRAVFGEFVRAKQALGEDVKGITFSAMCRRVASETPKLLERYRCERVRYEVSTADGRVRLLARPA